MLQLFEIHYSFNIESDLNSGALKCRLVRLNNNNE